MFNVWKVGEKVRVKNDYSFVKKGDVGVVEQKWDFIPSCKVKFGDKSIVISMFNLEFPYKGK